MHHAGVAFRSPGHRRHDRDFVLRVQGGFFAVQIPDVFLVPVYVDELSELAGFCEQVLPDSRMLPDELRQRFLDGGAFDIYGALTVNVRTQRGGDVDVGHSVCGYDFSWVACTPISSGRNRERSSASDHAERFVAFPFSIDTMM